MAPMTNFPDSHRDLLDAQFASLATIDGKGFPQVTETWFLFDEGQLKLSLSEARLKTRHLRARPQCSLMILDLADPMRYLEVRGLASLAADEDGALAAKVGAKYGGVDLTAYDQPGDVRVAVTIEPRNVYAVDMHQ